MRRFVPYRVFDAPLSSVYSLPQYAEIAQVMFFKVFNSVRGVISQFYAAIAPPLPIRFPDQGDFLLVTQVLSLKIYLVYTNDRGSFRLYFVSDQEFGEDSYTCGRGRPFRV